jgi:PAS domain S-box-containing protein
MPENFLPIPFISREVYAWASVIGLVAIFIADWFTPLGFGHGMLYSPMILLALIYGSKSLVLGVGFGAVLFTLIGMLFSPAAPDGLAANIIIANRVLSVLLIVLTTGLSLWMLINFQKLNNVTRTLMATQQHLSEQHNLLRIASQVGHLGGWAVSLPDEQVNWTDEVANMHHQPPGYHPSVDEAINFYHPDYREHVRKLVRDCIEQGTAFDDEVKLLTRDQDVLWVRIMGTALCDHQGNVIRIQGAIQDISQRKQIEDLIRLSHEKFSNLADAMPIVVWSAQANGVVDYVNRALSEFSGLDIEELLQPGRWLSILHPDDYERAEAYWRESVDTGTDYIIEFRIRRKDGEYRWHLTRAQPVRDELGIIAKWYGGTVDIHEHKMLEREHQFIVDRLKNSLS